MTHHPAGSDPAPGHGAPGELLQLVLTTPTVEAHLHELAALVDRTTPAVAGCGITLHRGREVFTVASSNDLAAAVDEVQYSLGEGPCLTALRRGEPVVLQDTSTDDGFGDYPAHALARAVRSSSSVPMRVDGATVGALNAYSREPHAFTEEVRAGLVGFAAQAEVSLTLTLRAAAQSDVVEQLHAAMQSRSVIDQAMGIIMDRQRCTAEAAFAVLRAASQSRNRKITDIAADLVTSTTGEPPRAGRFAT